MLFRSVKQLTNSGLRTIDYASGRSNRVDVAARRAVMTGITQFSGQIADMNAEKLGTDYFEVAWHAGARPTHQVWQGRVYSKEELVTVCGLGTVTGLEGINCYHERFPFFPGISVRNWSDEWLDAKNKEENTPKQFHGKEYTVYEAKQRQRQMETAMRAQRQNVKLLQSGGADPEEVILARCKYQGQLDEYGRFSKKMGLKQERERIYLDLQGRVAPESRSVMKRFPREMIENAGRDIKQYERYKRILGEEVGSLANFGNIKYNDSDKFAFLKKMADTYSEINRKNWSEEFKQRSKEAYKRFSEEEIFLSVHALSRLPRLNKKGYSVIEEQDVMEILKSRPQYKEGKNKIVFFSEILQLSVIKNLDTDDIVTIVRAKRPKGDWKNV